jgi:hypothetical protein
MKIVRSLGALGFATAMACANGASAAPPDGIPQAVAASSEPIDQLARDVDHLHPLAMALLAKRLFDMNRKDEAVFWFYEAQLRWLARFATFPELNRGGDALSGESEGDRYGRVLGDIGPDINRYAADDVPALLKTLDRVLEWDAAHPDAFSPPGPGKEQARKKFATYRAMVEAHADDLLKASADRHAKAAAQQQPTSDDPYPGEGGGPLMTPQELVQPCAADGFKGFRTGVSTKAEVARTLGAPESWFAEKDGGSTLSYACNGAPTSAGGLRFTQRLEVTYRFDARTLLVAVDMPKDKLHP